MIAGWIADSVSIPVIVDGDTGHGGIMAVRRLVRESIRAGLAGIRIDDQPIEGKRKTQNAGIDVVPLDQAIVRYRAAVDMKNELDPTLSSWRSATLATPQAARSTTRSRAMRAYREEAGVDWVQFKSPHSVDEIRAARAAVEGPFSFMRGKLGRYLGLDEHLALGVNDRLVSRFHPRRDLGGAVGFHDRRSRRAAPRPGTILSRAARDRPYPTPEVPAEGEGDAKQQAARTAVFRRARRRGG